MRTPWRATAVAGVALIAGAALPGVAAAACTPKDNLEAIIDDSGSMSFSDPSDLRIRAMELLMDTQGNEKRTLGAVEFGTDAAPLFGPGVIGSSAAAFKSAMSAALIEDGGGTDYNAAFAAAGSHNSAANGRIFLTDGEHTAVDPYANGHAGGPPVYVLGLGVGIAGSARRPAAAADRHRDRRPLPARRRRQRAAGGDFDLNSAITCQAPPKRFTDAFTKAGKSQAHTVKIPGRINTAQFALTWANAADAFTIGGFRVIRRGKVVARSAKVRKLKVSRRRGTTFTTVRVSGLVSGKLRFSVKADAPVGAGRGGEPHDPGDP